MFLQARRANVKKVKESSKARVLLWEMGKTSLSFISMASVV